MHPPEAPRPANRAGGRQERCHCLKFCMSRNRVTMTDSKSLGACAIVDGEQRKYPPSDPTTFPPASPVRKEMCWLASLLVGVFAVPLSIAGSSDVLFAFSQVFPGLDLVNRQNQNRTVA